MDQRIELLPCMLDPRKDCPRPCGGDAYSRAALEKNVVNLAEFKENIRLNIEDMSETERRARFQRVVDMFSDTGFQESDCFHYQQIMSELYS